MLGSWPASTLISLTTLASYITAFISTRDGNTTSGRFLPTSPGGADSINAATVAALAVLAILCSY